MFSREWERHDNSFILGGTLHCVENRLLGSRNRSRETRLKIPQPGRGVMTGAWTGCPSWHAGTIAFRIGVWERQENQNPAFVPSNWVKGDTIYWDREGGLVYGGALQIKRLVSKSISFVWLTDVQVEIQRRKLDMSFKDGAGEQNLDLLVYAPKAVRPSG